MNVTGSIQSEIVVKFFCFVLFCKVMDFKFFSFFFAEVTTCFGAPFKE